MKSEPIYCFECDKPVDVRELRRCEGCRELFCPDHATREPNGRILCQDCLEPERVRQD